MHGSQNSASFTHYASESVNLSFSGSKEGLLVIKFVLFYKLVDLISQAFVEDFGS